MLLIVYGKRCASPKTVTRIILYEKEYISKYNNIKYKCLLNLTAFYIYINYLIIEISGV